jgi:hypothetical protein
VDHRVGFAHAARQALVRPAIRGAGSAAHGQDGVPARASLRVRCEPTNPSRPSSGSSWLPPRTFLPARRGDEHLETELLDEPPFRNDSASASAIVTRASMASRRSRKTALRRSARPRAAGSTRAGGRGSGPLAALAADDDVADRALEIGLGPVGDLPRAGGTLEVARGPSRGARGTPC